MHDQEAEITLYELLAMLMQVQVILQVGVAHQVWNHTVWDFPLNS